MSIEKVFAIKATPFAIYHALDRELTSAEAGDAEGFEVLRRDPGRSFKLRVTMGGIPCWLTYTMRPTGPDQTEVSASLTPYGLKYTLFKIITLGMRDQGFALALVQGLANLKAELEGTLEAAPEGTDNGILE